MAKRNARGNSATQPRFPFSWSWLRDLLQKQGSVKPFHFQEPPLDESILHYLAVPLRSKHITTVYHSYRGYIPTYGDDQENNHVIPINNPDCTHAWIIHTKLPLADCRRRRATPEERPFGSGAWWLVVPSNRATFTGLI